MDGTCPSCGANLTSVYLPENTTLNGYGFGKMLGQGGFGITYLARKNKQTVAIKEFFPDGSQRIQGRVIPPSGLNFTQAKTDFLEETRILKQLMQGHNSTNIVDVYETFEANNTVYMAMEYLEGQTLEARILQKGKLKAQEVRDIAQHLCNALEIVHGAGLLHRDIKPGNVFLTKTARVVLIDFGSARVFKAGQTMRHTRMVTPGYAPLEQYSSEARVGAATDVYALSATLYHALTGVMPPTAIDRMNGAVLNPLNPQLSVGLREAITKGLSLQMADRPADAKAFGALVTKRNPTPPPKPKKPKPSNPKPPRVMVTPARGKAPPNTVQDFINYNPDFLAFLNLGLVLFLSWLMLDEFELAPFPILETAFFGIFRLSVVMVGAWLFTWLLELPLAVFPNIRKPVGIVRRALIVITAFALAVIPAAFLAGSSSVTEVPSNQTEIWLLFVAIFIYAMLFRAYKFPTQAQTIKYHHWWDAFWLVCIATLIEALKIWNW